MKPSSAPIAVTPFARRLSGFLDVAAFFLLVLALCVRTLFPALASGADSNILLVSLLLAASALVALRAILLSQWPDSLGFPVLVLAAYTGLVIVLAQFARYRYAGVLNAIDVAALFLLVFAAGATLRDVARVRLLLAAFLAILLCLAIYGLYQHYVSFPRMAKDPDRIAQDLLREGNLAPDMVSALRNRVLSQEVFATFLLSNTFASYLLVLIPLGLVWAYLAFRRNQRLPSLAVMLSLYVVALALYCTKSKGAWLAFPAALAFSFLAYWKAWPRLFRRVVLGLIVIALVAVVLLVALRPLSPSVKDSADVRLGYWQGAARLVAVHPFFGIGPGNFHDTYTTVKSPEAGEVQHPHNGYLEICSETGAVGLCLWLTFWFLVLLQLRKPGSPAFALDPPAHASAEDSISERWLRFVIGGACLLAFVFQTIFVPDFAFPETLLITLIAFAAAFYAILTSASPWQSVSEIRAISIALFVGIMVFLLHSFIDIDMSDAGITWTVFALVVCCWRLGWPVHVTLPKGVPTPSRACPVVMFGALILAFAGWWLIVIPIGTGARYLREADDYRAKGMNDQWLTMLIKAGETSPGNEEIPCTLGQLCAERYRRSGSEGDFDSALKSYALAQKLRPFDERPAISLSRLYLRAGKKVEALEAIDRALAIYPTHPGFNRTRGQILEDLGRNAEAAQAYRQALDFAARTSQRERRFSKDDIDELRQKVERLESKTPAVPITP